MKGRPVDQLVYEHMFPKPRPNDVQNFQALLHRYLILEVRQEVTSFYGHLDTQEAKYPGLDYCHPIHRTRLSRWPWHRRLFRAFDALRLTNYEISNLTKWEGTKWAKERFERDSGIFIRDTAGDDIPPWVEPEDRPQRTVETPRATSEEAQEENQDDVEEEGGEAGEESDGELESIGYALNERLRERAAQNEAAGAGRPAHYEDEWEQWLKNAIDSGEFPFFTDPNQQPTDTNLIPQALFPPNMLTAARAGQWEGIPDWLRDIIRRTVESERTPRNEQTDASSTSQTQSSERVGTILERFANWRRYSEMSLSAGTGNRSEVQLQRTAQPGA